MCFLNHNNVYLKDLSVVNPPDWNVTVMDDAHLIHVGSSGYRGDVYSRHHEFREEKESQTGVLWFLAVETDET